MRDFRDAKAMAQTLREALKPKSISLTHSESLELVAKVLGFHDWNVLSARIQSEHQPPVDKTGTAIASDALAPVAGGAGLPTLPLRDLVLFPRMIVPLFVGRDTTKRALERAMAGDKLILVLTQRRSGDDNPAPADLYGVGITASVLDFDSLTDGTLRVTVKGLARVAVRQLAQGPFLAAEIAPIEELRGHEAKAFALMREVVEKFRAFSKANFSTPPYSPLQHIPLPGALADAIASLLSVAIDRKQDLLETSDVITRLEKILALMKTDQQAA